MNSEQIKKLPFSSGPWIAGHLCNDEHSCDCSYILNEEYAGAIGEVYIDNEGGNDAPPLEEAKAKKIERTKNKLRSLGVVL